MKNRNCLLYWISSFWFHLCNFSCSQTVSIPNAYEDNRFDKSVDEGSNFKHKSILCMAIKNSHGQIIGVIQLINKFNDLVRVGSAGHWNPFYISNEWIQVFTKNDENFVEAFAIFCGMGIHNTHMYEKAIVAMAKQSVTLEVLSYHASASIEDAHRLRVRVEWFFNFQILKRFCRGWKFPRQRSSSCTTSNLMTLISMMTTLWELV